jgi:hypothetical protein
MSFHAQRALATMAAEDGNLQDADGQFTEIVNALEAASSAQPDNGSLAAELAQCLLGRATVRSWAVRLQDALSDLARVEALAVKLKPINKFALRVGVFESRARLLSAPYAPKRDMAAAWFRWSYDISATSLRLPRKNRLQVKASLEDCLMSARQNCDSQAFSR